MSNEYIILDNGDKFTMNNNNEKHSFNDLPRPSLTHFIRK
jgi:hypothetical protein